MSLAELILKKGQEDEFSGKTWVNVEDLNQWREGWMKELSKLKFARKHSKNKNVVTECIDGTILMLEEIFGSSEEKEK
jgi:hypothetical protein